MSMQFLVLWLIVQGCAGESGDEVQSEREADADLDQTKLPNVSIDVTKTATGKKACIAVTLFTDVLWYRVSQRLYRG